MSYSNWALGAVGRSVLHVTTVPASLGFVRDQVGYTKARGWTVHVLSAPGPALDQFGRDAEVTVHAAALTRRLSPLRDTYALFQIARVIRNIRPTVVHAHTPKGGLLGVLAGIVSRSTIRIYHVRGLPFESANGWRRALLRGSERLACSAAHRVICHSASLQQQLLTQRLCAPHKCTTLAQGAGNGVSAQSRWNPAHVSNDDVQRLRKQLGLPAGAPVIGYIGRLARDKGVAELADAWRAVSAQHPNAQLLLLGASDVRDPVSASVLERLRTDPNVHFAGRVPDPLPYYALMDVVALPSYREGMPNVALEAAAMAVPVVATRVTGCVDAVQHGVTGLLVEPRSAAALAHALDFYLQKPALAQRHGRAGRERMLRDFRPEPIWHACHAEYDQLIEAAVQERALRKHSSFARRCFDVAIATLLLTLAAPFMALIALAVRIDLGAPILFRQQRTGAHGRNFTLHKFRTMRDLRTSDGRLLLPAMRVTRLGRWLRSTSLDELPQLWDVLRGRMSLVGPRPLLPDYLPLYSAKQARRHEVRPGVTGWAQIHGRNDISWEQKLELDVWYVDHASPMVDLEILLRTIPQVLARRNVSPRDRLFMERFRGSVE